MAKVSLQSVQMSDGSTVEIPADGVVILVGPNNAGKSQFLRDIVGLSRDPANYRNKTLSGLNIQTSGHDVINEWIAQHLAKIERDGALRVQVEGWGEVGPTDVVNTWNSIASQNYLGSLTNLFILHADGNSRLTSANPQPNLNFTTQLPTSPDTVCLHKSRHRRSTVLPCRIGVWVQG